MAFNKIILRHSQYAPTSATTASIGEVLVQHASEAKDAALHILLNDGKTFESIPSKTYVDEAVSSVKHNTVVVGENGNISVTSKENADGSLEYTVSGVNLATLDDVQDVRDIIRENELVVSSSLNDLQDKYTEVSSVASENANAITENARAIATMESFLYSGDTNNVIDTVKDVIDYFSGKEEEASGLNALINDVQTNTNDIESVSERVKTLEEKDNSAWDDAAANYLKNVKVKDAEGTLFEGVIDEDRVTTIDLGSMVIDGGSY